MQEEEPQHENKEGQTEHKEKPRAGLFDLIMSSGPVVTQAKAKRVNFDFNNWK